MNQRLDLLEAIARSRAEEDRIQSHLLEAFPSFEKTTPIGQNRSPMHVAVAKKIGRRTWVIECWAKGDRWKAGLLIKEQVARHNYYWENAEAGSVEEAIAHLKKRIQVLSEDLAFIGNR